MPDSRSGDPGSKAKTMAERPGRSTTRTLNRVLLVLGTPGVGKTTLAQGLSFKLGLQMVDLGVLVRREKLHTGFDKSRKAFVVDQGRVSRRLERLTNAGGMVIATHFVGKMILPRRVKLALVLRLDPTVLYRRLRAKGWSRRKAWENVESEIVDVCLEEAVRLFGKEKVFEVDTTSKSRRQVLSEALEIVTGRKRVPAFRVDWLAAYDPVVLWRSLGWKGST